MLETPNCDHFRVVIQTVCHNDLPDGCLAAAVGLRQGQFLLLTAHEEAGPGLDLFLLLERDGGHLSRSQSQKVRAGRKRREALAPAW